MCPAGCRPRRNRSSTALRVGSAKAPKVASGEYVTERFRIMRNFTVTNRNLSRGFSRGAKLLQRTLLLAASFRRRQGCSRAVSVAHEFQERAVDARIVAQFGMERRSHGFPLPDDYGIISFRGDYFDARAEAL